MSTATSPSTPVQAPAEPTPADYDPILRDLLNPSLTLAAIAARFNTPILSLVAYINRPFIQKALRTIIAATNDRAQLLASAGIHAAVQSNYQAIEEAAALAAEQPITANTTPAQLAVRARMNEQARKASAALLRLTRPDSAEPARATRPAPAPRASTPPTRASASQRAEPAAESVQSDSPAPKRDNNAAQESLPVAPQSTSSPASNDPAIITPELPQTIPRAAA